MPTPLPGGCSTEWPNLSSASSLALELCIDVAAAGLGQLTLICHARRGGVAQLCYGHEVGLPAAERLGERRMLTSHRYLLGAAPMCVGRLEVGVPGAEGGARADGCGRRHRR